MSVRTAFVTGAVLSAVVFVCGDTASFAQDLPDPQEEVLREAKVGVSPKRLLEYLRKNTGKDEDLLQLDRLIRQLGSEDFGRREEASARLAAVGTAALPALRQALNDKDAEIARRAKDCAEQIAADFNLAVPKAVVRLLVRHKPEGAVEALLGYLPFAAEESLEEEIWYALDALATRDGKVHPALARALGDALPARRAVAGCLVGRRGDAEQRTAARKLLADVVPAVRLRAAQGLLAAQDKEAVPALVELMSGASIELAWQAEELLRWVAGEKAPQVMLGAGAAEARRESHKAWQEWWRRHGPALDLAAVMKEPLRPGLVLLLHKGDDKTPGRVWLIGCDGTTRWELTGLSRPVQAQLLVGGRLLLAETVGDTPLPPAKEDEVRH